MKNISIPVKTEEKNENLRMTIHLGEGKLGDTPFEVAFTGQYSGLQISVGDKKHFVEVQDIITQVVEGHEAEILDPNTEEKGSSIKQ